MQLGADVELPLSRRLLQLEHDVHIGDGLVGAAAIFLQCLEDFAVTTFAFALHDVELNVGNGDDGIRLHVWRATFQSFVAVTDVDRTCDTENSNRWNIAEYSQNGSCDFVTVTQV